MRRLVPLLLIPLLALAACGSDDGDDGGTTAAATGDPSALDAITVESSEGNAPKLSFSAPFSVDETTVKVIEEGSGEAVESGAQVLFDFVAFNARDGKEFLSSYDETPQSIVLDANESLPALVKGMVGRNVGARVLIAAAPADAWGPRGGIVEAGIEKDDTTLFLVDVREIRHPLERADGSPVEPVEGLPVVSLDDSGKPSIDVPDETAPTSLVVQPLKEGEGAEVQAGQQISVHYTGILWASGEQFDSSWDRGVPAAFQIGAGRVIDGWDQGLVGQKIGSQVLLVIPPELGYGTNGNPDAGISGTDTLVFVVDILDAY
jgi:peptidylprolyl isomerase